VSAPERRRLVVVGCGFGGYSLLRRLPRHLYETTLVTPRNYFLFTPLLPSAAVGSVELRSIVEPARRRLREVRLVEGSATSIDLERRLLAGDASLGDARFEIPFDDLVLAVGVRPADFGIAGVAEHAVPFTTIEDAREVRRRLLGQFARAAIPGTSEIEARRHLTFFVCGGGPTGVEVAAELHDLVANELTRAFPELAPLVRIVLAEATDRLLASFDSALAEYTSEHFAREGIDVQLGRPVERLEPGRVIFAAGEPLEAGLMVWAAGTRPSPLIEDLALELDRRGRILVDDAFRVRGAENVWAIGDCAADAARPLPATAQVAQQQGAHLARCLADRARGRTTRPFRFRSYGMLAYIGSRQALADLPQVKWSGRAAWFFWRSVYLTRLVSPSNKVKVLFDWIKARLFGRDLARF